MAKKDTTRTPRGRIRQALRKLWLSSRERGSALKIAKYRCNRCGIKQSVAKGREVKVQVHHRRGIDWDGIADMIIERVLQRPEDYEVLCIPCHDKEHETKERQDDFDKDKMVHEGRLREMQMDAADEARQGGGIE